MIQRLWNRFLDSFLPMSQIAKELAILRELYELDLASRNPPIYRITEAPGKSDTEITYADDEGKKKSKADKLVEAWEEEE
jgi:hypothetical protein